LIIDVEVGKTASHSKRSTIASEPRKRKYNTKEIIFKGKLAQERGRRGDGGGGGRGREPEERLGNR